MNSHPFRIHQFHYSASNADAVTNQMFFIRQSLAEAGVAGEIFAKELKGEVAGRVQLWEPTLIADADLLLLHHSHGNPALAELSRIETPKALVYHNITPSSFFSYDPYLSALCEMGRHQLLELKRVVVASFADSQYNAFELRALGFAKTEVFPLLDLAAKLRDETEEFPRRKAKAENVKQLLFVGKLAPHKNQALLLKVLFYLNRVRRDQWRLVLVGREDPIYGAYLKMLAKALDLSKQVVFAGQVSEGGLREYYRNSDAFVCVSQHEGFCIPLTEAMSNHLPIFALPTTGVKETLGGSAIRLNTRKPEIIAEVISTVLENPRCQKYTLRRQRQQLHRLAQLHNASRVATLCLPLVKRGTSSFNKEIHASL
jgi:glycosyltransferase involved in cell wall biosynthesis